MTQKAEGGEDGATDEDEKQQANTTRKTRAATEGRHRENPLGGLREGV